MFAVNGILFNHESARRGENFVTRKITLAAGRIAAGCKILKGTIIRDGAVIGAQSLVKGEIPENAIAVGIPAKVKKYRE